MALVLPIAGTTPWDAKLNAAITDVDSRVSAPRSFVPTIAARESVLTTFQAGHGYTKQSAAGTQSDDTTEYRLGSQALRMVTDGAGTACFTQRIAFAPTVDMTGRSVKVMVRVDDHTRAKELSLYISSETPVVWTNYVRCAVLPTTVPGTPWMQSADWMTVTMSRGDFVTVGTGINWAAVTGIRIRWADQGGGLPLTGHINLIATQPEPATGIVSLTCDDGWLSQYTEMRRKLDQYRYGATAYLISDLIDNNVGYMTSPQVNELRDLHGWEMASHAGTIAVHNARFTTVTLAALESDMQLLKQYLLGGGYRAGDHIAYPGGQYNPAVLALMRRYFTTGRSIYHSGAAAVASSETYPPADWMRLRAWSVDGTLGTDGPTQVNAAIDHAATNREWLILVFHKLTATVTAGTEYLIADFGSIIDKIASTSGIVCKTIADVVRNGAT